MSLLIARIYRVSANDLYNVIENNWKDVEGIMQYLVNEFKYQDKYFVDQLRERPDLNRHLLSYFQATDGLYLFTALQA